MCREKHKFSRSNFSSLTIFLLFSKNTKLIEKEKENLNCETGLKPLKYCCVILKVGFSEYMVTCMRVKKAAYVNSSHLAH